MKLIEKFLLKRCSTEVQVMLTRMKERPEDFDYGTGWRKLVEIADDRSSPYTSIERKMIRKYWKECKDVRNRNELLSRIMQQTINPTTREDIEDGIISKAYAQKLAQYSSQQALQGGLARFNDPRAVYGQYGENLAQGIYVNPHNNAQGRIV